MRKAIVSSVLPIARICGRISPEFRTSLALIELALPLAYCPEQSSCRHVMP